MPCALAAKLDDLSEEEQVAIYRATWWADLITAREWAVLLHHDDATPTNRSRLKRKAAGWLIALGRIMVLDPPLFFEIADKAAETWRDQISAPEWDRVVTVLAVILGVDCEKVDAALQTVRNEGEVADSPQGGDES